MGLLLKELNKEYSYVGSRFSQDEDETYYGIKILSNIQKCLQQNKVLVLKDLDFVYSSLYDLFNQSFTYYFGKRYSRIAFGLTKTPLSLVYDEFKNYHSN